MKYLVNKYIEIKKLTQLFYDDHPHNLYPEILSNIDRPYSIALFKLSNYYVGVPFRTYMRHNNGFLFSNKLVKGSRPGLDYSKIVIFKNEKYIGERININNQQQAEFKKNIATITSEIENYIQAYIDHYNNISPLHPREFQRKYGYSTLKYFHEIIGIKNI